MGELRRAFIDAECCVCLETVEQILVSQCGHLVCKGCAAALLQAVGGGPTLVLERAYPERDNCKCWPGGDPASLGLESLSLWNAVQPKQDPEPGGGDPLVGAPEQLQQNPLKGEQVLNVEEDDELHAQALQLITAFQTLQEEMPDEFKLGTPESWWCSCMDKTPEERLRALADNTRTSLLSDSATVTAELFGQNDIRFHSCKLTDGFRMALQDAKSRFRYIQPVTRSHIQPSIHTHSLQVHTTNPQHASTNQYTPD